MWRFYCFCFTTKCGLENCCFSWYLQQENTFMRRRISVLYEGVSLLDDVSLKLLVSLTVSIGHKQVGNSCYFLSEWAEELSISR